MRSGTAKVKVQAEDCVDPTYMYDETDSEGRCSTGGCVCAV